MKLPEEPKKDDDDDDIVWNPSFSDYACNVWYDGGFDSDLFVDNWDDNSW